MNIYYTFVTNGRMHRGHGEEYGREEENDGGRLNSKNI